MHEQEKARDVETPEDDAALQAAFAKLRAGGATPTEAVDPEREATIANVVDSLVDFL